MLNMFFHGNGTLGDLNENDFINSIAALFCKKGYSNTDFSEIALALNVSESELRAKYEDKQSLFCDVAKKVVGSIISSDQEKDPVKNINRVIDRLKIEVMENTLWAEFLYLVINSKDIPEEVYNVIMDVQAGSSLFKSFKQAQAMGYVVGGNTDEVIKRFITSSLTIMKGYNDAGLMIPGNDVFLSIVSFNESPDIKADKEIIRQQNSVIAAFASDFQNILFVDLDTDKMDVYQSEDDDPWVQAVAQHGYDEYMHRYSEKFLAPEEKAEFLKEMNPDNIKNKLDEEPIYYIEHKLMMNGEMVPYQTKIVLDPMYAYGNKVLVGSHRVYK